MIDGAMLIGAELRQAEPLARAADGSPFRMRFSVSGREGARRQYEATGQPIRGSDGERGSVIVIREVSSRTTGPG